MFDIRKGGRFRYLVCANFSTKIDLSYMGEDADGFQMAIRPEPGAEHIAKPGTLVASEECGQEFRIVKVSPDRMTIWLASPEVKVAEEEE